jgi:hypothetical protein
MGIAHGAEELGLCMGLPALHTGSNGGAHGSRGLEYLSRVLPGGLARMEIV